MYIQSRRKAYVPLEAQQAEIQSKSCWKASLLWKLEAQATGCPSTVNIDTSLLKAHIHGLEKENHSGTVLLY